MRQRLSDLGLQLDRFLAKDYGVDVGSDLAASASFSKWKESHKPFHWLIEFYGIISSGGFDIVIGNPPYIASSKIKQEYSVLGYETARCSDIYAWIMERAAALTSQNGLCGMIVPLSLTFSGSFQPLRRLLFREFSSNWFSSFARIPAALFSADVRVRNTIHIGSRSAKSGNHTTIMHRWFEEARPYLAERIEYAKFLPNVWDGFIPKLGNQILLSAFEEAKTALSNLDSKLSRSPSGQTLHFKQAAYNWISFGYDEPPSFDASNKKIPQTKVGRIYAPDEPTKRIIHTLLNGKIAFLWWSMMGDDFDVTRKDIEFLPFPKAINAHTKGDLEKLSLELDKAMNENLVFKLNAGKKVGNYNLARCREVTDRSDKIWISLLSLGDNQTLIDLAYAQIVKTNFDN